MKTIGIKLADGSFYPVLEDNTPSEKNLELTTAHNNQTKIMVDLYRSASCSMEDAEYVDSLQIENLVARPNGEPSISFNISIDEDNKLSAKIIDEETGNESNTTITLVSRTLEERLITDEYDINDSKESDKSSVAGAAIAGAAAGGLLATAMALRNKSEAEAATEPEEPSIEDTVIDEEEPAFEEFAVPEETVEEPLETSTEDFSEENSDEAPAEEESALPDMDFDLPDDISEESSDEVVSEEPADALSEDASDEIVSDEVTAEEVSSDAVASDETFADTGAEDIPDMDFDLPDDTATETTETTDSESDELPDMDFDLPDDSITEDEQPQMPDDFFDMEDTSTTMSNPSIEEDSPVSAGLNFDGLYDEETERGTPAEDEVEEVKKKTKVPVIICIICAIICIIATLLILFIIPSKYNLLTRKNAKDAGTTVAIEQPEPEPVAEPEPVPEPDPQPKVPEAKEDEVIIIEKAEEVVPKQPPVAKEKPKNITYKIKWGDTLWDIADTYYKNPWRYKYIARYNGIRNPDYIISGTLITIPAE